MSTTRRRRRRRTTSMSKWFRQRILGLAFLIFGVLIVGTVNYVLGFVPQQYIYVSNTTIGVATTPPAGASAVSNTVIIQLIGWAVGILFVLMALRKLGLKI